MIIFPRKRRKSDKTLKEKIFLLRVGNMEQNAIELIWKNGGNWKIWNRDSAFCLWNKNSWIRLAKIIQNSSFFLSFFLSFIFFLSFFFLFIFHRILLRFWNMKKRLFLSHGKFASLRFPSFIPSLFLFIYFINSFILSFISSLHCVNCL